MVDSLITLDNNILKKIKNTSNEFKYFLFPYQIFFLVEYHIF